MILGMDVIGLSCLVRIGNQSFSCKVTIYLPILQMFLLFLFSFSIHTIRYRADFPVFINAFPKLLFVVS